LRHVEDGPDQRDLGQLDLAAQEWRHGEAKAELFCRRQIDGACAARLRHADILCHQLERGEG
jgi:hypothetical protein